MTDPVEQIAALLEGEDFPDHVFDKVKKVLRTSKAAIVAAKKKPTGGEFSFTVTLDHRPTERAISMLKRLSVRTLSDEFAEEFGFVDGEVDPDWKFLRNAEAIQVTSGLRFRCQLSKVGECLLAAVSEEPITETALRDVVRQAWDNGGEPQWVVHDPNRPKP